MNILLTNDDGIHAPGIQALYRRFAVQHAVTLVAPDRQRSAVGHSITLHKPIRCDRVPLDGGGRGYAVSGTPADCVKLAVHELMEGVPDLVLSGINPGANVGFNVNYSGTVCAAKEAGYYGIPAIAVSHLGAESRFLEDAAAFVERVAARMFGSPLPKGCILNLNIPDGPFEKIPGVRITRLETSVFEERFERRVDPRNRIYYWQGCERHRAFSGPDTDAAVLNSGFISLTPLRWDHTELRVLEDMKRWALNPLGGHGR